MEEKAQKLKPYQIFILTIIWIVIIGGIFLFIQGIFEVSNFKYNNNFFDNTSDFFDNTGDFFDSVFNNTMSVNAGTTKIIVGIILIPVGFVANFIAVMCFDRKLTNKLKDRFERFRLRAIEHAKKIGKNIFKDNDKEENVEPQYCEYCGCRIEPDADKCKNCNAPIKKKR